VYAAALAQNNRELQDFAFVASHDLQEPLRKISAFGKRLEESSLDVLSEESRDYLDRMQQAAQRMQTLMSDLLDFSRITTRAQPFASTDLNSILSEVLSDLETRIEQTGGRVEAGVLPVIDADHVQMRQLLQNLIANALKFHRKDLAPVIRLSATVTGNSCELSVEDNGIGFEQKYLDRIFTPFQRLHGRHEYEGTGMGLAICRKIVERHGGSITAISTPGNGSSFIVTMPIRQSEAGSALWTQRDGPSASSWPTTTQTTAS
jgi:light-regulated signal transduction histidine kinase (bacteriophytochrome)